MREQKSQGNGVGEERKGEEGTQLVPFLLSNGIWG